MREYIKLADSEITKAFGDAFAGIGEYEVTPDDLTLTQETIENFIDASNNYSDYKSRKSGEVDGLRTLEILGAQVRKGMQRHDVHIIDFGAVRAIYS